MTLPWQDKVKMLGGDIQKFKNDLRSRLSRYDKGLQMPIARHALLAGPDQAGERRDPENLLLYNLQEWTGVTPSRPTLRFERTSKDDLVSSFEKATIPHPTFYYRYWTEPVDSPFLPSLRFPVKRFQTEEVNINPADFGKSRFVLGRVIAAISDMPDCGYLLGPHELFALRVTLRMGSAIKKASFRIKETFDGIVAALHYYDFQNIADVAGIMSEQWSMDLDTTRFVLSSRRNRVLGRRQYIRLKDKGTKFGCLDPGDHLCHEGEFRLESDPGPSKLSLVAELFA